MGEGVEPATVLVVDDDASFRLLCRVNLELDGYRVLEAGAVPEAEEVLRAEAVDLLLLDIHVGPDSGIELMRMVRGQAAAPRVVLVTGSADLDARMRAEVDGVVPKPFTLEELLGTVGRLVSR